MDTGWIFVFFPHGLGGCSLGLGVMRMLALTGIGAVAYCCIPGWGKFEKSILILHAAGNTKMSQYIDITFSGEIIRLFESRPGRFTTRLVCLEDTPRQPQTPREAFEAKS